MLYVSAPQIGTIHPHGTVDKSDGNLDRLTAASKETISLAPMPPFRHALDKSEETRLGGAQQETPEFPLPFRRQHHTAEPAAAAIGLLPEISGKGRWKATASRASSKPLAGWAFCLHEHFGAGVCAILPVRALALPPGPMTPSSVKINNK